MSDFQITRGDGRTLTVTAVYPEGHSQAGQPYDLTGKAIWFTAKRHISDSDLNAAIAKETGAGIELDPSAPGDNVAVITIDSADTDDSPDKKVTLVYDVQVKATGEDAFTALSGTFDILPDVTRATS